MAKFFSCYQLLLLLFFYQCIPFHLMAPLSEQTSLATEVEDLDLEAEPVASTADTEASDLKASSSFGHGAYTNPYYKSIGYPSPYYDGLGGYVGYGGYSGYGGLGGGYGGLGFYSGYGLGYPYYGGYYHGHYNYPYGHYY